MSCCLDSKIFQETSTEWGDSDWRLASGDDDLLQVYEVRFALKGYPFFVFRCTSVLTLSYFVYFHWLFNVLVLFLWSLCLFPIAIVLFRILHSQPLVRAWWWCTWKISWPTTISSPNCAFVCAALGFSVIVFFYYPRLYCFRRLFQCYHKCIFSLSCALSGDRACWFPVILLEMWFWCYWHRISFRYRNSVHCQSL
jgi:hypothetical protein